MTRTSRQSEWSYRKDASDAYKTAALYYLTQKEESAHWMQLLLWAEAQYEADAILSRYRSYETTARQKEVQRLWQQRGLLERARANLRLVWDILDNDLKFNQGNNFGLTQNTLRIAAARNVQQMRTVSERIPK
jgi:hypothetical protein